MTSAPPPHRALVVAYAALVGLGAGAAVAASFMVAGVSDLRGATGAAAEYGAAMVLALGLGAVGRWRDAGAGKARVAVAVLLVFATRRWLTGWIDLAPLGWRSGSAGLAPVVVFPLVGLILGAVFGLDAITRPGSSRGSSAPARTPSTTG